MILDPSQYGCSSKLPFNETLGLSRTNVGDMSRGDYSISLQTGPYAHSIDRVFRCAEDWQVFADIAVNHAFGDVLVAGSMPLHAMFAFEFGPEADEAARREATSAFFKAAEGRSVQVGKCHSSVGPAPTSVTIAVCGTGPSIDAALPTEGIIYLSRPLGAFKMHFLREMGVTDSATATDVLTGRAYSRFCRSTPWAALSDVSGDGLAGAILSIAARSGIDAFITLGSTTAFAPDVLNVEVECLINPEKVYRDQPIEVSSTSASLLMRLKETAGPFIGLLNTDQITPAQLERQGALVLGSYSKGTGKVRVEWQE